MGSEREIEKDSNTSIVLSIQRLKSQCIPLYSWGRALENLIDYYILADEFDLDNVWSIKRNITVPGRPAPPAPSNVDGWSKNVGKNFYSRHGGLNSTFF